MSSKRTLAVCGDSYMSPRVSHSGKHFAELFADKAGFELIAYSRGGMSNGGIALQIESALVRKPDLILVGTTTPTRIEYCLKDKRPHKLNASHVLYIDEDNLSTAQGHVGKEPLIASMPLNVIFSDTDDEVKKHAIKLWFEHLYSPSWKQQQDRYVMYAILHKLHLSGIPYIICYDHLGVGHQCPWLHDGRHIINKALKQLLLDDARDFELQGNDPGFHSTYRCQQKIALELLIRAKQLGYVSP